MVWIQHTVHLLARGYTVFLVAFLGIRQLVGERWNWIAALNSGLHLALIGAILVLIIIAAQQIKTRQFRPLWIGLALVPVIYFVAFYGKQFIPRAPVNATSPAAQISILTFNMHTEAQDIDPIADIIAEADADIVLIQEMSKNAAAHFDQVFDATYPYRRFHTAYEAENAGQGVMSRYPITYDDYWRNDHLNAYLAHQHSRIETDNGTIAIINAHPMHPIFKGGSWFNADLRSAEIDTALARAQSETGAIILAGDFNMADQSDDYQRITTHFTDAYHAAGWGMGFTFPNLTSPNASPLNMPLPILPIVRLDYIFHNDAFRTVSAEVWHTSGGSDHHPIYAVLEWR